jgi:hypothetical protein
MSYAPWATRAFSTPCGGVGGKFAPTCLAEAAPLCSAPRSRFHAPLALPDAPGRCNPRGYCTEEVWSQLCAAIQVDALRTQCHRSPPFHVFRVGWSCASGTISWALARTASDGQDPCSYAAAGCSDRMDREPSGSFESKGGARDREERRTPLRWTERQITAITSGCSP